MKLKSLTASMVIIVLIIVAFLSGCLYPVSGPGNLVTEQFNYTGFKNIEVSNVFEVEISRSDTYSIDITADDNIILYKGRGCRVPTKSGLAMTVKSAGS